MIAVVPGYISRSVAGSYDNEGIEFFFFLRTGQHLFSSFLTIAHRLSFTAFILHYSYYLYILDSFDSLILVYMF